MWNFIIIMTAGLWVFSGSGGGGTVPSDTSGMSQPVVVHAWLDVEQAHTSDNQLKSYGTLNGISLSDSKQDVISKLGSPAQIEHEPLSGIAVFRYPDMEVGIRSGYTEYVHVKPSATSFQVDGQRIGMTTNQIRASLGEPYFRAEDGDVYLENNNALKVFMDRDSGDIIGVDLFFDYSDS
ncbi:hypothetical protein JCM10914A_12170 [Paenibacillus sp. JCM 10914]|uniref:hypothetical protein n=1 Tax=Paenibacillus sp. JCM 10914 TaxID=1236974 RepID=UPI0003CC46A1|nr:hypothetical protein [Paenibacillus sp. JCM 10914]GAE09399.1 hypothetical protein JCM10914_5758 [Paenibacillus sp. JCM 10914]